MIRWLLATLLALTFLAPGARAQTSFTADAHLSLRSIQVANNTTAIVVKGSYGTLYGIEAYNNSTTIAYIKVYNAATATCGSGTPHARYMIPKEASGSLFVSNSANGDVYPSGITVCITTDYADNGTNAPAANAYIVNIRYK